MSYVLVKRNLSDKDSPIEEIEFFGDKHSGQAFLKECLAEYRGIMNHNHVSGTYIEWGLPAPKSIKLQLEQK